MTLSNVSAVKFSRIPQSTMRLLILAYGSQLWQCLFYGLDDDLWTGLVFYRRDLSEDGTIFYRLVVDVFIILADGMIFQT